jgi:hypothetical protein
MFVDCLHDLSVANQKQDTARFLLDGLLPKNPPEVRRGTPASGYPGEGNEVI